MSTTRDTARELSHIETAIWFLECAFTAYQRNDTGAVLALVEDAECYLAHADDARNGLPDRDLF